MCLVSIIIPVYNAEKYIYECVQSILLQDYENIEVICVDDGSTDNSYNILNEFQDERLICLRQDNAGAPAARNHGLMFARGEYCMFFDADDLMEKHAINNLLKKLMDVNADFVIGSYMEIDCYGDVIESKKLKGIFKSKKNVLIGEERFRSCVCSPLPGTKLFRMDILKKTGLKFEQLSIGQDLNFFLKLLGASSCVALCTDTVMYYRIVDGSISRQYSLKVLDIINSMENVRNFFYQNDLKNAYQKYISVVELIAYRSQLEKARFLSQKKARFLMIERLSISEKQINHKWSILTFVYIKEKIKIILLRRKLQWMN